ncbi:IclR family transcriptional regulator [Sphingomonas sp.]|uniref:IclR family transcriptional regulator n=1 Tax=Sphingomonas sp. TaxID=28214 RepID=UPI002D7FCBA2|nr:helix-turn-helix domain-containing protein [Sphingomonas sp.]HEU0045566.1 helix-turn-helix domain-containing protein [Sphingomonas sp.]
MRRPVVKSASRALEVLELFNEQRRPLRLQEIYELLDYPQSSATHLMKSMVHLGYVNYNRASRAYVPTCKVRGLGNWLSSAMYGQTRFHRLVDLLQRRTDETVALSMQNDLFIQYFIIKPPGHDFKMPPDEGNMRLLTDSTSGMALLSRMSAAQVDKICRHINYYEANGEDRVEVNEVLREWRWVKQVGYCYREHHPDPSTSSMAFPLEECLYGIPLALGVGGLADRLARNKMRITQIVRETIAEFHDGLDEGAAPRRERARLAWSGQDVEVGAIEAA